MRAPVLLVVVLAALSAACSGTLSHDQFPGRNVPVDLRPGEYDVGAGYEPLPISLPPQGSVRSVPDRPWVEQAPEMRPVHPEITPVAASRLVALLPEPPAGWSSEQANGVTLGTPQGEFTEASRSYWKGPPFRQGAFPDGKDVFPSIGITIVDRGQTGLDVADPADEKRGVTIKPATVGKHAGQVFTAGPGFSQLDFDVEGRFHVRVRGGHVSEAELSEWASRIKLADLGG